MNQFTPFGWLAGFGMYSSFNITYYYLMDWTASKIYILNDKWVSISSRTFSYPSYMISIGNSLYMNGQKNFGKVDQYFNILINYNPTGGIPSYVRISYNSFNGLI